MKKLFALLFVCYIHTLNADTLSDAIRASNVDEVRSVLSNQKFTTQQMMKYLDTAEQIIRMRRDNPALGKIDNKNLSEVEKFYEKCFWASWASMVVSYGVCFYSLFNNDSKLISCASVCVMSVSSIGLLVSLLAQIGERYERMRNMHDDAISIKEILYDHLNIDPAIFKNVHDF